MSASVVAAWVLIVTSAPSVTAPVNATGPAVAMAFVDKFPFRVMTLALTEIPPSRVVTAGSVAVPALMTVRPWIGALMAESRMLPDVVVVKATVLLLLPPAERLVAVRSALSLLSVMAPSVVVADVMVSAPPPLWANVMGALAPTVARLLRDVADALLFAIFMAAAPPPLVEALPDVTPDVTS